MTSWSHDIDISNILQEYPRPLMERSEWQNLKESILVPYPWKSPLSGIKRQIKSRKAWYKEILQFLKVGKIKQY